jgi:aspartate/methionine/tyrosine aminotransferase
MVRAVPLDSVIGLTTGFVDTKATDRVQRALWRATPRSEKAREPNLPESSSAKAAARKLSKEAGVDADEQPQR